MKDKNKNNKPDNQSSKTQPEKENNTQPLKENPSEPEKLRLEIKKLRFETSTARYLEVFKGLGVVVTSLGIVGTILLGISQLRQTQLSRDDERFEREISRLGSPQATERLTGLAGIQQFLRAEDATRQENALRYLINAAVIEKDDTVRGAMLDLLNAIPSMKLKHSALDEGLVAARDRNRAVLKRLVGQFWKQQDAANKRLVDPLFTEVPIGNPTAEERAPLEASAQAVAALVRAGAQASDLSGIYCVECKFSTLDSPSKLPETKFDNSWLRRADFSGANLKMASFQNSDLILANFTSANLESAKLTAEVQLEPAGVAAGVHSGQLASAWGANFACSNLSFADFSGRTVFSLIYENPTYGGNMRDEFYNANLEGTKLKKLRILVATPESKTPKGDSLPFLREELSPTNSATFSSIEKAVAYFSEGTYSLWIGELAGSEELKSLNGPYRRDLYLTFSSIRSARNWEKAELPDPIKSFIALNDSSLAKPFVSYNCKTGQQNVDITDMFSKDDKGPKQTRF